MSAKRTAPRATNTAVNNLVPAYYEREVQDALVEAVTDPEFNQAFVRALKDAIELVTHAAVLSGC